MNNTITYSLPKHGRAHANSLIHRGANDKVIREDSRVIFTNPCRKVSVLSLLVEV